MKATTILISLLLAMPCRLAMADMEAGNHPVVRSDESGYVYAKSVPEDDNYGQKGNTKVFLVGKEKDRLMCEYDWYAREIYVYRVHSPTLVRFGPWPRGSKPQEDHLALGFYRDGKTIREYSTLELQKLGSGFQKSSSHYMIFDLDRAPVFRRDSDVFEVEGASGKVFDFDLETGAIVETCPERADADVAIYEASREATDKLKRPQDYKIIGARQVVEKGKYVWIVTFKPTRLLPPDPASAEIGERGEVHVQVDVRTHEAQVTGEK